MTPRYSSSLVCTAATAILFALALPVPGQALDAPTLTAGKVDRTSIVLQVTAGASGAPAGFVIEWMKRSDYNQLQGWPTGHNPAVGYCTFSGVPTLTVGPSGTYSLGANATIRTEIGDLFDETGISTGYVGELPLSMEYAFRAYTGSYYSMTSGYSSTLFVTTSSNEPVCIRTQGFWKNHTEAWPVTSLTLGTTVYTQQEILDILNTPANGNGLIFLAHQLIAAKLNVASGATPPGTLIADADALIDGLVIPPVGSGFLDPSLASDLTDALDDFNNGLSGTECEPVPVDATPWGRVKGLYR